MISFGMLPPTRGWLCVALLAAGATAHAQSSFDVPAGASQTLAGGSMDMACGDVTVEGTLDLGGGSLTGVRHLSVAAGGQVILGTGSITLAGNWANAGTLAADTGSVNFVDNASCATQSTISGNSTFYTLNIASSTNKVTQFTSGSTQTVQHALTLTGVQIQSTAANSPATINLLTGGTQSLSALSVQDMTATGQWLAPNQTNLLVGGRVSRWFGTPSDGSSELRPVPATSTLSLLGMALAIAGLAARRRRQPRAHV